MDLDQLRKDLHKIDEELVELYKKRIALILKIREHKKENHPIFCPDLEEKKKGLLLEKRDDPALFRYVQFLFEESCQLQLKKSSRLLQPFFRKKVVLYSSDERELKGMKVFLEKLGAHVETDIENHLTTREHERVYR
ncbi:MAG: chorismate mutase [Chlamydiia bacterium]